MKRQYVPISTLLLALLPWLVSGRDAVAQPVPVNPVWLDFYGVVHMADGTEAPPGTRIDAYEPGGLLCGSFVVRTPGKYGFMPVFGDDVLTPADDGIGEGELVSFQIDGYVAQVVSAEEPIWTTTLDKLNVDLMSTTSVAREPDPSVPSEYALEQNYPNPFNPETVIRYTIPPGIGEGATLEIYNALGAHVRTLFDRAHAPGSYETIWDGRDDGGRQVASGVYVYRLKAGQVEETKIMVLVR